ncbi:hypothetical protein OOJ09_30915 [Mesorhizobium qingshengii]|uniref:Uncharacterized protein n=1 Tax=Mesorhizobium qingshengii TaxID=1165689 RepID=A0ABT4R431_9HYPH|nr:hypothetical protein [Mesorhizobium qingshengii]MCZ8548595.1 hypothetical protein [Mesorhizobium qingshengii]
MFYSIANEALDEEFQYGRERRRPEKVRRHPLNIVFDPFYPMIVAIVSITVAVWYFDIPIERMIDLNTGHLLRKWIH